MRAATEGEVQGLEPAAVWAYQDVIERLDGLAKPS